MTEFFSKIPVEEQGLWGGLTVVATDIDGTLTGTDGRVESQVVSSLAALRQAGIKVCLVTGRPSGWVQGLLTYLPADAAIAENGGVIFPTRESVPWVRDAMTGDYHPCDSESPARPALEKMYRNLSDTHGDLRITEDNFYRLSDYTFHAAGLSSTALALMRAQVETAGLAFTWSTIHAHIMPAGQEKGTALEWLLARWNQSVRPAQTTLTVGDSPNDVSLFSAQRFPVSAGVANIVRYKDVMENFPKRISESSEGLGFADIINAVLKLKGR